MNLRGIASTEILWVEARARQALAVPFPDELHPMRRGSLVTRMDRANTYNAHGATKLGEVLDEVAVYTGQPVDTFAAGLIIHAVGELWAEVDRNRRREGATRRAAELAERLREAEERAADLAVELARIKAPIRRITQAMRAEVYARDGYRCLLCGADERLSLDHVIPFSQGGACDVENLQTLCLPCNIRKGARFLDLAATG